MKDFLAQSWLIASKDLRLELRNREALNAAFAFALTVLLLFSFAFDPIVNPEARSMAGGLLWVTYAFAGVLLLNRSFSREAANDCIVGLTAAPLSGGAIFTGKAFANSVLLLTLEIVSLPIFVVFYDVRWPPLLELTGVLALGAIALTAVGTIFAAVTVNSRLRELMLPLLVLPIALPALIACVELTRLLFAGEPLTGDAQVWVKLLLVFDLIFSLLGATLLDYVLTA